MHHSSWIGNFRSYRNHLKRDSLRPKYNNSSVMNKAIKTANFQQEIENIATGFQITVYSNRVLVVISQTQTLGSVLLARTDAVLGREDTVVDISSSLGQRDNPALLACTKGLAQEIFKAGSSKPLVVCLALKSQTLATVTAAVNAVGSHPIWRRPEALTDGSMV